MSDTATDYAALLPDREVTVMGKTIMVREIRFAQSAEAMKIMAPVIEGLREIQMDPDAPELELQALEDLIGAHWGRFISFMRMATGQPREWIEGLPDQPGQELATTVLAVNAGFFLRRLNARAQADAGAAARQNLSTSSPPSSAQASVPTPPTSPNG